MPAEAQWEYACRGPGELQNEPRYGPLDQVTWYGENSDGQTHDVRQKAANGYGLYDMLGNVYEWCKDHAYQRFDSKPQTDPLYEQKESEQSDSLSSRVIRGGSWSSSARYVRAAYRRIAAKIAVDSSGTVSDGVREEAGMVVYR